MILLNFYVMRTCIISRMSSNFNPIGSLNVELAALERLKKESGSFRPWVVSPGRFALGRFALVLGVGRFALIR